MSLHFTQISDEQKVDECRSLLATHLAGSKWFHCPGCDGMQVEDVLTSYPDAAASGTVPCEAELVDQHPELAAQIVAFFVFHLMTTCANQGMEIDHRNKVDEAERTPPGLT